MDDNRSQKIQTSYAKKILEHSDLYDHETFQINEKNGCKVKIETPDGNSKKIGSKSRGWNEQTMAQIILLMYQISCVQKDLSKKFSKFVWWRNVLKFLTALLSVLACGFILFKIEQNNTWMLYVVLTINFMNPFTGDIYRQFVPEKKLTDMERSIVKLDGLYLYISQVITAPSNRKPDATAFQNYITDKFIKYRKIIPETDSVSKVIHNNLDHFIGWYSLQDYVSIKPIKKGEKIEPAAFNQQWEESGDEELVLESGRNRTKDETIFIQDKQ